MINCIRHQSRCIAIIVILVCAFTLTAAAKTVGCAGAPPGTYDFASLNAAIAAAFPWGDVIDVYGTCSETVGLWSVWNLTINGYSATLAEPAGPNTQGDVLDISDTQNLRINGLRIQANPHTDSDYIAVANIYNSTVTFQDSTIEGSSWTDGLDIFAISNVSLLGNTVIENNVNGEGVYVEGSGSSVTINRGAVGTCPLLQNNGDGVYATTNASLFVRRCAIVRNNAAYGLYADNGAALAVTNPQAPGAIQVLNNQIGLSAVNGGTLRLNGPVLVQGNANDGVRIRAARGIIGGTVGPTITQNGAGDPVCCAVNAGVSVDIGGVLDLNSASINGNPAPGVHATNNSNVRLLNNPQLQVTGNVGGVIIQNSSVAELVFAPVITGNGSDLSCTPDSRVFGNGSAVGRINCPGFQSQTNPGMGSKGKIIY